ncbi:MAG TPA: hypothetical protein VGO00_19095 [Kofleriaceae bacterium]|jgi:hypothetical protein|nr:hypothetical protein [Kofleriaceae bacterium]
MWWPENPEESKLVAPLISGRREDFDVPAYVAYLRGNNDPRGELLELIDRCDKAGVDDPAARARITELREQVWEGWVRLVAPHWLLGCGDNEAVTFSYQCPRTWAELAPTADPTVRHCDGCGEAVHRCSTLVEAESLAVARRCISIPVELTSAIYTQLQPQLRMITGRPNIPALWLERVTGSR